jgi:hypothetical protein
MFHPCTPFGSRASLSLSHGFFFVERFFVSLLFEFLLPPHGASRRCTDLSFFFFFCQAQYIDCPFSFFFPFFLFCMPCPTVRLFSRVQEPLHIKRLRLDEAIFSPVPEHTAPPQLPTAPFLPGASPHASLLAGRPSVSVLDVQVCSASLRL